MKSYFIIDEVFEIWSPSPRRAWIEMCPCRADFWRRSMSPSPRRAWIEICRQHRVPAYGCRRPPHGGRGLKSPCSLYSTSACGRRPPHGGRGLKYFVRGREVFALSRPPHGGRGLKFYLPNQSRPLAARRPPHGGRGLKYKLLDSPFVDAVVALPTEGVD